MPFIFLFLFLGFFFFFFLVGQSEMLKNDQVLLLAPFWFLVKLNIFSYVYCPFIFLPSTLLTSCFHFPTGMFFLLIWGESLGTTTIKLCLICAAHIVSRATILSFTIAICIYFDSDIKSFPAIKPVLYGLLPWICMSFIFQGPPCFSVAFHFLVYLAKASTPLID